MLSEEDIQTLNFSRRRDPNGIDLIRASREYESVSKARMVSLGRIRFLGRVGRVSVGMWFETGATPFNQYILLRLRNAQMRIRPFGMWFRELARRMRDFALGKSELKRCKVSFDSHSMDQMKTVLTDSSLGKDERRVLSTYTLGLGVIK